MERYAELFGRQRKLVLSFVIAMTALAGLGLSRLEFDDVPRGLFASEDAKHERLQRLYDEFGPDDNDVLLVLESEDWFSTERSSYLKRLKRDLGAIGGVFSSTGLADVVAFEGGLLPRPLLAFSDDQASREKARLTARGHPLVDGRLLSADGRTTLIFVRLEGNALSIEEIEPLLAGIRAAAAKGADEAGVAVRITGIPALRVEIYRTVRSEQILFFAVGSLICFTIGCLLFRSAWAAILASLPPVIGSIWALGFVGLLGQKIDILGTILPTLVIVIGFTDSVHLMIDVRLSRDAGATPLRSAIEAIRHLGLPCALTSLTTAVGFGSLALGSAPMIRRFGMLSALSVFLAFLAVITVLPLATSCVPWVGKTRRTGEWTKRVSSWIDWITAHARIVATAGIALTLGLALLSSKLVPENRLTEALSRGEAFDALVDSERQFGGILPCYVLLEWDASLTLDSPEIYAAMEDVEGLFHAQPNVSAPISPLGLVRLVPGGRERPAEVLEALPHDVSSRFLRADLSKALVTAQVPDGGSDVMVPLYEDLTRGLVEIAARYPGIALHLTGTDYVARSNINQMITGLAKSLTFAVLVILGVIALEFRSLFLGLSSLLPNLFPLAVVAGLLVLFDLPITMPTAVLFSVLLGLAVDDTIHFLARLRREEARQPDRRTALRETFLAVGKAIAITTVVLGSGFATVSISSIPTIQLFGWLATVGLVAAFVGDLFLLPAVLALGKRADRLGRG